ncbi:glycosyltransferase family 2 protein [Marilutibacter spongiae]|uniref:Glycosyltransferase family 2 protein n=1 Tax=Marilutibacter spongiae TaxID=2025720 RepID=A0A7W3TIS5_9GAMM|nr:glycosyltransferase family 2 protein [Lysobacter spongiae]MBB1059080.1 glycosyltransferase family 2 protein [Lysobacter spongiae]
MSAASPEAGIAAVVVTYRSLETIDECLQRLRRADGVVEIRVVDNGSDDGTVDILQRHALHDPRVRFIANPDNPGFAVACNQGAADSHEPWLAFVNPDCLPEPDALARLRALAASVDEPLLGADLVDEAGIRDAAARRHDPDFAAMLRGLLSGQGLRSTAHAMALAPDDSVELQPVEVVSGALMLMPRSLFERIGGFDERYRLHAEDLDLCRRARGAGATLAVANRVRVVHVRGVSSRSRPVFVEWHKHRGLWRYFRTFEAPRRGLAMRAAVFATIWLRFPVAVMRALLR